MDKSTVQLKEQERPLANIFFLLFYCSSILNLTFNFLGSPVVKYIYLAQVFLVFISLFLGRRENYIWVFLLFSLFEGQGRVLWGYHPFFRLIFDISLALMIVKELSRTRKLLDRDIIPNYLTVGIFLHFIWFLLEVFNPRGPAIMSALATSKYYIFPFFLFFLFKSNRFEFGRDHFQKKLQGCLFILFLVCALVIYQTMRGEELLFGMSMNYLNLRPKFSHFIGKNFRPWGTSFIYGGMGTLIYCTVGFWLLYNPKSIGKNKLGRVILGQLFKWSGLGVALYASFLGQVRSATLKTAAVVLFFFFLKFLGSKVKAKRLISSFLGIVLIGGGFFFLSPQEGTIPLEEQSVMKAADRWDGVLEGNLLKHRAGLDTFVDVLATKVELPFGHGLGMTQSFLPGFEKRRRELSNGRGTSFWHLDNLIVFLFLELGFGALIYLFILTAVLVSLFSKLFTLLKWQEMTGFSILAICCSSTFIFLIFNWGAVSIPFNPESFYFWLWSAIGFSTFFYTKKRRIENS